MNLSIGPALTLALLFSSMAQADPVSAFIAKIERREEQCKAAFEKIVADAALEVTRHVDPVHSLLDSLSGEQKVSLIQAYDAAIKYDLESKRQNEASGLYEELSNQLYRQRGLNLTREQQAKILAQMQTAMDQVAAYNRARGIQERRFKQAELTRIFPKNLNLGSTEVGNYDSFLDCRPVSGSSPSGKVCIAVSYSDMTYLDSKPYVRAFYSSDSKVEESATRVSIDLLEVLTQEAISNPGFELVVDGKSQGIFPIEEYAKRRLISQLPECKAVPVESYLQEVTLEIPVKAGQ